MATSTLTQTLTLAAVRGKPGTADARYLFLESPRLFRLAPPRARTATALEAGAALLRDVARAPRPLVVTVDPRDPVIHRVAEPGRTARAAIEAMPPLLEKPARPLPIDLTRIDPTRFDHVDTHQKWPAFKLCNRLVPGYAKAKEVFDYCAALSCHLPGPPAVAPCIPFQYVRDGCYARAHQMRRLILRRYRYCVDKVFSFANQNDDQLSVRANKWGGCCVNWWYHVAPLVRVAVRLKAPRLPPFTLNLAMVIDPGMFDAPVHLSTWLAAQQDAGCAAGGTAHVSMYAIQPGSAYSPANYEGTQFNTDPDYIATEATLLDYRNLSTCP